MTIKARIIILGILLFLIIGGSGYLYLWLSGKLKIGAEAVVGCQNTKRISALLGRPGTNLVSYNFFGRPITVNALIVPYLDRVQTDIQDKKINYSFDNVQAFNLRAKRDGGGLSLHSWGIALDINPERNPQGGDSDIPPAVIDIFKKHGFFWGGDWTGQDRDPMHFEWYGASLSGEILDRRSHQRLLSVATTINGSGSPNANGVYRWIVPAGTYEITAVARGYEESKFKIELSCFTQGQADITLEPLPAEVPGSIAGKISIAPNYPLLVPANIYLDGRQVTLSNIKGDYFIPNVHEGKHQVDAKIMFFPGNSTMVEVMPGDKLQNVNIVIGR